MNSLLGLLVFVCADVGGAEPHPIWEPGLETAVVGRHARGEAPESVDALAKLVSPYLQMTDRTLLRQIGPFPGGAVGEGAIRERAAATYNLALLFELTGDREYARRSATLLLAYADQFPLWRYKVCPGECGIWTDWYHADIDVSRNLALAFDLLAPRGIFEDFDTGSESRVRDLLVAIVRADLEFRLYTHNWAFLRPMGLVIFGRVLDDPELVHEGYWFLSKILHELYTFDGFIAEGTYSYHAQMTEPMLRALMPFYLDGYSDPEGYAHVPFERRWDPRRIDSYSLERAHGAALRRMKRSLRETALPNGQWPILNETKHYAKARAKAASKSLLLAGIGHALLRRGESTSATQLRLDFSPTLSHNHRDALNLIYFDHGTEAIGGTAYRHPKRDWNRSTFSQNLVIVDRQEQKGRYFVDWTKAPYRPGDEDRQPVLRRRWSEAQENLHNNVTLFVPPLAGFDSVQVIEADAANAYGGSVDRYLRTLVMVEAPGGSTYTLDLFRVRGGTNYDWAIHGGHAAHELAVDLPLTRAIPGLLGRSRLGELAILKTAAVSTEWTSEFTYEDGVRHRIRMSASPGTTVSTATGPRFEHGGSQPHLLVHRAAGKEEEQIFAAIHETHQGRPRVESIERMRRISGSPESIGLRIQLADGSKDYVIHALDAGNHVFADPDDGRRIESDGRLTHIRILHGRARWTMAVGGRRVVLNGRRLISRSTPGLVAGAIARVERIADGALRNAFVLGESLAGDTDLTGQTIHVTWGNGWTWAYPIESAEGARVFVPEDPGFRITPSGVDMQYFPVQEILGLTHYPGPVRFEIPIVSIATAEE